jgi:hypothetical protein
MDTTNVPDPVLQDVTDRETMQAPDDDTWSKILDEIRVQYPALLSLTQALPLNKLSIDGGFVFKVDPLNKEFQDFEDFRYYHVEPLLDQAADLLDRILRDRAAWDDLMLKSMYFHWDIEQFQELDVVHRNEIKAGMHTVDYKESYGRNVEDVVGHRIFGQINKTINTLLEAYYTEAAKKLQVDDAANAAYASAWPMYQGEVPVPPANLELFKVPGLGTKADALATTAGHDAKRRVDSDEAGLNQIERQSSLGWQADFARSVGSTARFLWEYANSSFKLQRDKIARDFIRYKARLANTPGNPLHYTERIDALSARFMNDFTHAVARIKVVRDGLKSIYGYDVPLPSTDGDSFGIDECVLWVRTAINWLVRFSRVDQNYVLAVSVKQCLKEQWSEQAKDGNWNFEVPEDLFPDQRHVRLRGLGVSVVTDTVGPDLSSTWVATVRTPVTSSCVHRDGKREPLNQSSVPPCRLGRVTSRYIPREMDVTGASALHNVSPFGTWNVALGRTSSTGLPLASIQDVVIDLHLAVHAA